MKKNSLMKSWFSSDMFSTLLFQFLAPYSCNDTYRDDDIEEKSILKLLPLYFKLSFLLVILEKILWDKEIVKSGPISNKWCQGIFETFHTPWLQGKIEPKHSHLFTTCVQLGRPCINLHEMSNSLCIIAHNKWTLYINDH